MGRLEYDRFGGPELILRASFALPQAQANETAVRAAVASINAMDCKIRSGEMKMCTGSKVIRVMGTDFALGNRADSQPDCSRSFVKRWARTSRVGWGRQVSDLKARRCRAGHGDHRSQTDPFGGCVGHRTDAPLRGTHYLTSPVLATGVGVRSAPLERPVLTRNPPMHNIIDTAVAAGNFKTLAAALTAAGLVDTVKGTGPFTVFAPTDDAFAKLPDGTVDKLLKDVPKLKSILTYHVVSGKVMAADVMKMDGKTAKTVNGADLKIGIQGGVKLNGSAHVTKTDIECSNGVIHVVDAVLMPPA